MTRLRRWWRYRRELARLMGEATARGDRVRSRQRYDEMCSLARLEAASRD